MYGGGRRDRPHRGDPRPPHRLRARQAPCASATPPTARPSTTCGARCSTSVYLHMRSGEFLSGRTWNGLAEQVDERDRALARARPGDLGDAGRLRSTSRRRRSCAGWRATGAPGSPRCMDKPDVAARWQAEADRIKADILDKGVDERGVFTQAYGSTALDASLLLAPLLRFLPADDPRIAPRCSRSPTSSPTTGSCCAIASRRPTTASRARRARSRSARSGWSRRWWRSASSTEPASCASACCPSRARSGSTPRRSTRAPAGTGGTSRRRSPTWRRSTR